MRRENVDGPADPELSEAGHMQAKHCADWLHLEHVDAVYSSPLRRAVQTAEPLAALKGLPIRIEAGVAEFDQHSNEYIPVEELKASNDPRWQEMMSGSWQSDEDRTEFRARVIASVESIVSANPGGRVVVTCHGGVINEYVAHVLGLPEGQFFYPNYTSIHRIAASSRGHRSILSLNESGHLRGTGLPVGLFHG